jgi:Phage portal protein
LLGDLEKATFQNVESLSRFFIQSSLGFYVDHIEDALTAFFGLPTNEYIYFDVETALLRSDLKERMEAYAKGIQNGVMAPNEARARESLPPVDDGDQPRVQQQLVPLSYGMQLQPKAADATPPGTPSATPSDTPSANEPQPNEDQQQAAAFIARKILERAMTESI